MSKMLKVSDETHARLTRLSALYELPMTRLIEVWSGGKEEGWHRRMSEDEWSRYLAEDISRAESRRIRARAEAEAGNGHGGEPAADVGEHGAMLDTIVPIGRKQLAR
jgi:hypothetical protein